MKSLLWFGVAVMALAIGIGSGCENAEGVDGLAVSPAAATTGGASSNASTVVFAAQVSGPLALPLEWTVANPALGVIVSQSGSNAVYKARTGVKGENVILVRDQYDNEGSAIVTQL